MSRSKVFVALLLLASLLAGGAPLLAAEAELESFWITIGEDVFLRAQQDLAPLPGWSNGVVLERFDEHDGVVLTRIPAAAIDALSQIVHEEFGTCGGFVKHESLEEARDAMARLRAPQPQLLALPFSIDQPTLVNSLAGQVSAANLLSTITSLSTNFPNRYHAHHAVHQSATWIKNLWTNLAAGRPDVTVEFFSHGAITPQPSVILTIPGSVLPNEYVILGAHQDSIVNGCAGDSSCIAPGADDDASGVAVLTEVIRIALSNGFQPQRTVQFMAYAAEEVGLDGSDDIADSYDADNINVVAVLQQDMTAYEGSVNDIYLITDNTDPELTTFLSDLIDTYQPSLSQAETWCDYGCSDHASWHSRGFRAAFSFEAKFKPEPRQYNPQIHTSNDTVATFGNSAAHAAKFARLAVAFMVEAGVDVSVGGTLRFSPATATVGEPGGTVNLTVDRAGSAAGTATVHCRTVAGGTATPGQDYTETDATLSWGAGQGGNRTCSIPIINDTLDETNETIRVELQDATGAAIGSPSLATVTITDNDEGGVVQFVTEASASAESAGTVTVSVQRAGGAASGVTVAYAVTGGTATGGGVDYTLASGQLSFDAGATSASFEVALVDDFAFEPDETVQIQLSAPTGGSTLGARTVHTLTILDDDLDLLFADGFESGDTSEWSLAIP